MRHPAKRCTYDDTLLVTVLVLVIAGLVLLTSISAYNGNVKFHDSFYYLKKQGFATGLGLVGMAVISKMDSTGSAGISAVNPAGGGSSAVWRGI